LPRRQCGGAGNRQQRDNERGSPHG
jgi:hypothetical protein